MKSRHFFIGVFVLNFIFTANIFSGDSENKISNAVSVTKESVLKTISSVVMINYQNQNNVDFHRVTPLSPKKTNTDCPVTPLNTVMQNHGVTPVDHGTTPVKEHSELDKENENPDKLVRTDSMSLRYSYSNNGFGSCNSFDNLVAFVAANATPSSPKNNGLLKGRALRFPSHCNDYQEGSTVQR